MDAQLDRLYTHGSATDIILAWHKIITDIYNFNILTSGRPICRQVEKLWISTIGLHIAVTLMVAMLVCTFVRGTVIFSALSGSPARVWQGRQLPCICPKLGGGREVPFWS